MFLKSILLVVLCSAPTIVKDISLLFFKISTNEKIPFSFLILQRKVI